jgi:hypothetical protein
MRTCNKRIRMRIREAQKHTDPDADPEHLNRLSSDPVQVNPQQI